MPACSNAGETLLDIMGMKEDIFFLSDAHLGADDPAVEESKVRKLLDFFDHVNTHGHRLVILGDLFDFWFEYRRVIASCNFPILAGLWNLRRNGIRIDYYLGNHDYWTSGFLSQHLATTVHDSPSSELFGKRRAFLAHGDGLSANEKGYLYMKRILRSPISATVFSLLHPDAGAWLARLTSRKSRQRIEEKRERTARNLRAFARKQLESGAYDWIIVGHSHQPEKCLMDGGTYLNIGDWSEHFTYGRVRGEEIHLEEWPDR
jgi:UDP-2,3-diacylglucosamine hydrolase